MAHMHASHIKEKKDMNLAPFSDLYKSGCVGLFSEYVGLLCGIYRALCGIYVGLLLLRFFFFLYMNESCHICMSHI